MPIDERWDQVSEEAWENFARSWLEELRNGETGQDSKDEDRDEGIGGKRDWGLTVTMMNFTARPEQQWKFILLAVGAAESDDQLGHIAAGPIEHLLGWHGEAYIAEAERQSADDAKFARAMTGVRQNKMSDEIWARVRAIQAQAEPLKYSGEA